MKEAFTETVVVSREFFCSVFLIDLAGADAGVAADVEVVVDTDATDVVTGVAERLGSLLIVRSLPWVSIIAFANSANLTSSAVGSLAFANANTASTGGEDVVLIVHSY
jgi:hypothetical protein